MDDDWKEVTAEWQGETGFFARNPGGAQVQMGMVAGQPGASPMELFLASLAGCTGSDVASILAKQRQSLQAFKVRVRGKRRQEHPRVYTEIEVEYLLWGKGLEPEAVERAITLSQQKYCSVSAMLKPAVPVHYRYQILEAETAG